MSYFDALETRSQDEREAAQLAALNAQLDAPLTSLAELSRLPVLRKSDLTARQKAAPQIGRAHV